MIILNTKESKKSDKHFYTVNSYGNESAPRKCTLNNKMLFSNRVSEEVVDGAVVSIVNRDDYLPVRFEFIDGFVSAPIGNFIPETIEQAINFYLLTFEDRVIAFAGKQDIQNYLNSKFDLSIVTDVELLQHIKSKFRRLNAEFLAYVSMERFSDEKLQNIFYVDDFHKKIVTQAFKTVFGNDNVDCNDENIIIHFPEFTIENSNGLQHVIKDLYVKLTNIFNGMSDNIQGCRATMSNLEWIEGYEHSHLTSGKFDGFKTFCLGTSGINELITLIKSESFRNKTEEEMKNISVNFCLTIENFVKWESLEGTPYMYIENIYKKKEVEELLVDNIDKETNVVFSGLKGKTEEILKAILPSSLSFNSNIIEKLYCPTNKTVIKNNGNYYETNSTEVDSKINIPKDTLFRFKGKKIIPKIYYVENKELEQNKVLHPEVTRKVIAKLTNKFTTFLKRKYGIIAEKQIFKFKRI